jgi:transcription initiation factor IIF auxiliary subunit
VAERASDVRVRTSCFDPDGKDRTIAVREQPALPDVPLYRVFLFLDGRDLPYVEAATYVLHPTFPEPRRTVRRTPTNPSCKLETWAWGEYPMQTEVTLKAGDRVTIRHPFAFSDEVERAKREEPGVFRYV